MKPSQFKELRKVNTATVGDQHLNPGHGTPKPILLYKPRRTIPGRAPTQYQLFIIIAILLSKIWPLLLHIFFIFYLNILECCVYITQDFVLI